MHLRAPALCFLALYLSAFQAAAASAPPNDNFAQRLRLAGEEVHVRGTTEGATTEPGEPNAANGSVWYTWTAPRKATYAFSFTGPPNHYMEVFTGKLNSLMYVPGVSSPKATLRLKGGEQYQIRISAASNTGSEFTLKIRPVLRPPNDDFENAISFHGTNTVVRGTVRHATQDRSGNIFVNGAGNVWYQWQAPEDGLFFVTANPALSMSLEVLEEVSPNFHAAAGVPVDGIRRGYSFHALSNRTYWISVAGSDSDSSRFQLSVSAETPPRNDLFENSTMVAGPTVSIQGSSLGAKFDAFEPLTSFILQEFVWYSWTAPTAGLYRIASPLALPPSTNNGPGVPRPPFRFNSLVVSTGTAATSQVEVVRADAESGALLRAKAEVTYHIAVPGRMSSFDFKINPVPAEPNDDYENAALMNHFDAAGSTLNATPEPGHPYSERAVWFRWLAPSNGFYAVAMLSPMQMLGVYKGEHYDTTEFIAQGTRPVLRATAGEEFRFGVSPRNEIGAGAFLLRIDPVTPPANDDFVQGEWLFGTNVTFTAHLLNATSEPDEPGEHTVWFTWTAPVDGLFRLRSTNFLNYANQIAVLVGSHPGSDPLIAASTEARFDAEQGTTYRFQINSYDAAGDLTLELTHLLPPANDEFSNRIALTGPSITVTGTLSAATHEPGEPMHPGGWQRSVWWSWTAPRNARARIDFGSWFYPRASVYTGDVLADLSPVTGGNTFDFSAQAGVTYHLAVASDNDSIYDPFTMNIALLATPSNDAFARRKPLTRRGRGTTLGASREIGERSYETDPLGASVWWKWRAPRTGVYDVLLTADYAQAAIYTGNQLQQLELADAQHTSAGGIRLRAIGGTVYVIEISAPNGAGGPYELEIVRRDSPSNDNFADRVPLEGTNITVTGENAYATTEPDEGGTIYPPAQRSVWWTWTAPVDGTVFIEFPPGTNKRVRAYRGTVWTELEWLAANEKGIHFDVRSGNEYQIAVDAAGNGDSPDPWQFQLSLIPSPANDNFSSRTILTGNVIRAEGNIVGATGEEGERAAGFNFDHSAWWSWTAPEAGRYTFRLSSSNQWLTMGFFTGDAITNLDQVASDYGFFRPLEINHPFAAGETIAIRIDGPILTAADSFTLDLYKVEPPSNDHFANRAELINGRGTNRNEGASPEPGEPLPGRGSIWWRFTAATSGWHSVTTLLRTTGGNEVDPNTYLYTGNSLTALVPVPIVTEYPEQRAALVAGTEYALQVVSSVFGLVDVSVQHLPPPPNDGFGDAIPLFGEHASVVASNSGATKEAGEPQSFSPGVNTVWWRWTAPTSGVYFISDASSGLRHIDVFTGSSLSNLTFVRSTPHYGPFGHLYRSQGGVEHFIRVASSTYNEGAIAFQLDRVEPPINDDFADRSELTGAHVSILASNYYSTPEPGDPMGQPPGEHTVWWRWTAPASGTATIELSDILYCGIFRGNALTNLVTISPAGFTTPRTFQVEAGVEYSIGVTTWGYYTTEFRLTLNGEPEASAKAVLRMPLVDGRGRALEIETSTNLIDWEPFQTNSPGDVNRLIVPRTDEPQRFFRVR